MTLSINSNKCASYKHIKPYIYQSIISFRPLTPCWLRAPKKVILSITETERLWLTSLPLLADSFCILHFLPFFIVPVHRCPRVDSGCSSRRELSDAHANTPLTPHPHLNPTANTDTYTHTHTHTHTHSLSPARARRKQGQRDVCVWG
jgi:hypothetical protein